MKDGRRFCRPCRNKHQAEYDRMRFAADPEYRQRKYEATKKWTEGRYATDPKFKAQKDAANKRYREKLKQEKES